MTYSPRGGASEESEFMLVALTHCDVCKKEEASDHTGWFMARFRNDSHGNRSLGIQSFNPRSVPKEKDKHVCSLGCLQNLIEVEFEAPAKAKKRSAE